MAISALLFLWSNAIVDIDDAPISYRYAQNLADGKGFVYNEGEYIQGTTTPLYAMTLAVLHKLSSLDIASLSNFLGLLFSIGTVALTYRLVLSLSGNTASAFLAGLFLATLGAFVVNTMSGMETPMYCFFLMACFHCYFNRRYFLLGIAGGLLVLTRIDGLVLAGFLGLLMTAGLLRSKITLNDYLKTLIPFLLIAGAWFVFAQLYFGNILPQSYLSKRTHGKAASEYRPITFLLIKQYLFLIPALLLSGWAWLRDRGHAGIPLLAFAALYLLAYLAADVDFYGWYIMPLMPVFAAAFILSLELLKRWGAMPYLGALAFCFAVNMAYAFLNVKETKVYINELFELNRVAAGEWLHDHVSADASLGVGAIGHIGWLFKGRIIDEARLVTAFDDESQGDLVITGYPPPRMRTVLIRASAAWRSTP